MVWEQDVRVLVSLTAEAERGQVKCHRYWETGDYGPFHVENFAERHIHLSSARKDGPQTNDGDNNPCITVRHLALSHSALPFRPLREITQLQYPYWPDFGTTSQPSHLLELIGRCREAERAANDRATTSGETVLGPAPMLVHCSAGCGRTGTFCTVDSVLDLLRQSRASGSLSQQGSTTEERDLIADTLEEFRTQRPSMIQNLSQFVLCYESVLEWVTSQMVEGSHMER